jgi:hypothetical protein
MREAAQIPPSSAMDGGLVLMLIGGAFANPVYLRFSLVRSDKVRRSGFEQWLLKMTASS